MAVLPHEFLLQSAGRRLQLLQGIGLARFAPILTQMPCTPANGICLQRIFPNPAQVKFLDLAQAELQGLDLKGVNLIRACLRGAQLQGTCLQQADLIWADLSQADLQGADLQGATLHQTRWSGTQVQGCRLGLGLGLFADIRSELHSRGAILTGVNLSDPGNT